LQKLQGRIAAARTRLIVLTTDAPAQNLRIAKRLKLSMPILSDPGGAVLKQLGMWDARWKITAYGYYYLDPTLRVISRQRGYWDPSEQELAKLFDGISETRPSS
jgi:peroxiredoxin